MMLLFKASSLIKGYWDVWVPTYRFPWAHA